MSVRRLAEDAVQPQAFAFNRENSAWAKHAIKKYPKGREQSAVIPLLMRAQEQDGWVTKAAIEHVATMLDMPLIRVLEVATFYTQFQLKPVGTRAHIQVCGTTPCMLRGSEDLKKVCQRKIHHEQFHTNETGTLSWEEVECLGACVNAPMIMVFKDTYEDLTPERLEEIIDAFEAGNGASVPVGPQIERTFSAPQGPLTSLTSNGTAQPGSSSKAAPEAVDIPPSNAAKPVTHDEATNAAIRSPSPAKTTKAAEATTSKPAREPARARTIKNPPTVEGSLSDKPEVQPVKAASGSLAAKGRPPAIEKPAITDDLKLISGVDHKIETNLHDLGIYTFAQVAAWKKAERDWIDTHLELKGVVGREDWVKQAKALAKGGEAEYIRVFGEKPE
ncbi:NADH-quinone oxidoreductase subunit E [Phyllobacterium endophyticum]|uniref:NADH-quinone oxidoreductase subunit NuoE n=1 Tax=Phyllobacterium endophyticum TaxID=1149773 RepID=A0A2P7AW98_9HYPH|nr:NADH-quinone oxidoreductase subunit E [Phyllobacterium endophyticum]MBB3235071.1 NADH-quinone oxidoreductase subunit E [Phyllobacterium endophyticum]PSH58471.1 NADH-quinone oxidoreductase subunit NuoE [Phyllobacterium endophyticum]TXR48924.1 NADH-quinone oxidoreductase subunit E [Phyllobacterium endophyticum]TYR39146.1 NADH-quinone oxidoreductase subunit E [Phyllobacterium endophyticum]